MKRDLKDLARYVTSTPVQCGIRLCMACILVLVGNFAFAAATLVAPIALPWSSVLGLTAEQEAEQAALLEKVRSAAKAEVALHVKAFNEDGEKKVEGIVEKKIAAFKDLPVEKLKTLVTEMEEINKTMAELKAKSAAGGKNKKENLIHKAFKDHWEPLKKAYGEGRGYGGIKLEKKFLSSTSFGDRVIFGFREAGIDTAALPEAFILDLIQVMSGGAGSNPLSWIERNKVVTAGPPAYVTGPETVAEQGSKPDMKWEWVERKMPSSTIAAMVPITKQAIYNYPQLEQEIRGELLREFAIVIQQKILKGEGTGTGDDVKGIFEYATAFAAPTEMANTIINANEYDVIVAAATQILNANFIPSIALVTHGLRGKMVTMKAPDGHYILPPFSTNDGLNVFNVKVKSTNVLEGDEFLVMDPSRALWNWVENPTIEVGMINDDFKKNIWRLRIEAQGMLRIKNHETPAFVKGDMSDAISLLTT